MATTGWGWWRGGRAAEIADLPARLALGGAMRSALEALRARRSPWARFLPAAARTGPMGRALDVIH